jgi:pimeloyl-ACP methyl ester carboxylesterase
MASTSGRTQAQQRLKGKAMNIVLVHGAWSDGSGWSKVIPILQAAGHNVVAVQNEMRTLKADSDNTRAAIDALSGPTLLAGHSYGGAVMTSAGRDAKNVVGLVYIAAFAPDEGESLNDINARFAPAPGGKVVVPDARGLLFLDRAQMPAFFVADIPAAEGAVLAAVQRPVAGAIFTDRVGPPAWKQHKSWFAVSENDLMIDPNAERFMAQRSKATTTSLKSSHASLVSHPREVAELILAAANG